MLFAPNFPLETSNDFLSQNNKNQLKSMGMNIYSLLMTDHVVEWKKWLKNKHNFHICCVYFHLWNFGKKDVDYAVASAYTKGTDRNWILFPQYVTLANKKMTQLCQTVGNLINKGNSIQSPFSSAKVYIYIICFIYQSIWFPMHFHVLFTIFLINMASFELCFISKILLTFTIFVLRTNFVFFSINNLNNLYPNLKSKNSNLKIRLYYVTFLYMILVVCLEIEF